MEKESTSKIDMFEPPNRPKELQGTTYKIKTPLMNDSLYVTINDVIIENKQTKPHEIFINTKNLQHFSWIVAMTRLISAVFRNSKDPSFLVNELKSVYDPNGGCFHEGKFLPSIVAAIGYTIEEHLIKIGIIEKKDKKIEKPKDTKINNSSMMICPMCNEKTLVNQENCLKCLSCDYSKCS